MSGLRKVKDGLTSHRRSRARDGEVGTRLRTRTDYMATLPELLKTMVEMDGSDLHIATASPPQVRVHGHLTRLPMPDLDAVRHQAARLQRADRLAEEALRRNDGARLLVRHQGDLARFRCNVFNQRGAVGAVYRLIPRRSEPSASSACRRCSPTWPIGRAVWCSITGPTGSGKSTTLAAMIDKINSERHEHILTIEDPIEYIHQHKNCLVNQREVHSDTNSFANALARRAARGSRHRPDRRDARPGDGRVGAEDRRDRPPDVRHAAHQLGGADDQPHHRRLSVGPAGADSHPAVAGARRHRLSGAAAEGRRQGPRRARSRSWCRRRRSGT